jgi:hypothetical protein
MSQDVSTSSWCADNRLAHTDRVELKAIVSLPRPRHNRQDLPTSASLDAFSTIKLANLLSTLARLLAALSPPQLPRRNYPALRRRERWRSPCHRRGSDVRVSGHLREGGGLETHSNVECLATFTIDELPVDEMPSLVFTHDDQYNGDEVQICLWKGAGFAMRISGNK